MGEVYRANDARLGRHVAIKVLPSHLCNDNELKQRFEREARAIAALDHPNICGIYDIGRQDNIEFLVLEFIDGETLAQRIARGPLHLDQLLKIAAEIADGLDKAHRAGIVHRDLKPGNIMLAKDGAKLLDFGLAKPSTLGAAVGSGSAPLLSAAVTVADASPLTTRGSIVGTVQYMSPEQIEGKPADARSDIFALGGVLYEMATGKRPFEGKSQLSVASAILEKDPDSVCTSHPALPAALDYCIRTCLAKDPDERFQTAHDVGLQLRWVATSSKAAMPALPAKPATKRRLIFATVGTIGLILAALAGYWLSPESGTKRVVRAEIAVPPKTTWDFTGDFGGPPVISPDGSTIAYAAHTSDSQRQIWVRRTDSLTPQRLEGTDGASFPFFSPDSRWIAFFANGKLSKIPVSGGPITALADAPNARGGSWGAGDTILVSPDFQSSIYKVSASGGPLTPATKLDPGKHTTHRWPSFLPDGKHFLYLGTNHNGGNPAENGVYYASLDGKENRIIMASDSSAEYSNGMLLFHAQSSLAAQPFDPASGKLSGDPVALVDKVYFDGGIWRTVSSVSQNGILLYQASAADASGTQLVWTDATGKTTVPLGERGQFVDPKLSPDGSKIAVTYGDPARQIWIIDSVRGSKMRLTFDDSVKNAPGWSPDGKMIIYQSSLGNAVHGTFQGEIWIKPANGSGAGEHITTVSSQSVNYPSLSADGKYVAYLQSDGPTGAKIIAMAMSDRKPFVVATPAAPQANIQYFSISPDSRWVAYTSTESGRQNVYITSFPHASGKWQVSTDIGDMPAWRKDGKKVYFIRYADGIIYECDVTPHADDLQISPPHPLFKATISALGRPFDVSPDGKRFLVDQAQQDTNNPISLIVNWPTELKKK